MERTGFIVVSSIARVKRLLLIVQRWNPNGVRMSWRRCSEDRGSIGEMSAGTSAKGRRGSHGSLSQLYFLQIFPTTKVPTYDSRYPFTLITMADVDEDASHLRVPDAADYDPTEEAQDFLKLDKLTYAFTCPPIRVALLT